MRRFPPVPTQCHPQPFNYSTRSQWHCIHSRPLHAQPQSKHCAAPITHRQLHLTRQPDATAGRPTQRPTFLPTPVLTVHWRRPVAPRQDPAGFLTDRQRTETAQGIPEAHMLVQRPHQWQHSQITSAGAAIVQQHRSNTTAAAVSPCGSQHQCTHCPVRPLATLHGQPQCTHRDTTATLRDTVRTTPLLPKAR